MKFLYEALPARVLFGAGRLAEAGDEVARLGAERALIVSTPGRTGDAQTLAATIGGRAAGLFTDAAMHTPVDVTATALVEFRRLGADAVVALGGGSAIGLAKAIALATEAPQLAIPTTYSGSEMTPYVGKTENGIKSTLRSPKVLPETVIYDPDLTLGLPPSISGPSGMNAIAHAVEALYAENRNPVISHLAEESIAALGVALPAIMTSPSDVEARTRALYGAWLAATCLASAGMAIHHKICHALGGAFGLGHADIHALMIPYSAAFNRDHAPEAMAAIAGALGTEDAPAGLHALMLRTAHITSLRGFGLSPTDLDHAADLAARNPYFNPRPVTRDGVRALLEAAYEGGPPGRIG